MINDDSEDCLQRIKEAISKLSHIQGQFDFIAANYRPSLNGERYITDVELSKILKLNRRSLISHRQNGKIPYYHIGGKILYKESDIEKMLEENYYSVLGSE